MRRETPSTLALLARPCDVEAMRRYRGFPHRDHPGYLRTVERLLRSLTAQGVHTRLLLFDPARYARFCAESGLDPDSPGARARYTADAAADGPSLPYGGEPVAALIPRLLGGPGGRGTGGRRATALSPAVGTCRSCGRGPGPGTTDRARTALGRLLDVAGPGSHHLVCSVSPTSGGTGLPLVAALGVPRGAPASAAAHPADAEALLFTTVLAAGLATGAPGGVVLRTTHAGRQTVRGWRLHGDWLSPLTEAEVFAAYCTDPATGAPVPPEPGVAYRPGVPLPPPNGTSP
ncbi:hypothetical protein IF129_05315 [Streptomyces chumphonensis]|uniref:Uncharacterized protein n=1 Tax=Streptomyces chumphonensis TaxID=1214925 RepID=A0A927EYA8_9ACTN|nr:hypothetical protein [Streptomyces chumphonensis]